MQIAYGTPVFIEVSVLRCPGNSDFGWIFRHYAVGMFLANRNLSLEAMWAETLNHTKFDRYMNTLTAKGNWNIAKGKFKQHFGKLMHDDLQFFEGKVDELRGRIQKRAGSALTGIGRHAVHNQSGSPHSGPGARINP